MIRRIALTLAVACAVVVLAPTLMASEPAARSAKSTASASKTVATPMAKRSGYIVASS